MKAARLHGPRDLRVEDISHPGKPGARQVLLRVQCVGICGSDLHTYIDGRIGDTAVQTPLTLGHEFAGVLEAVGEGARDGMDRPLTAGMPVAVDPAWPCGRCELCLRGDPNLCLDLHFTGVYPDGGALCQYMIVPGSACFPIRPGTDPAEGALLETLGVALHAVDLGKVRAGDSMAILGAGPIGLHILQVAKLSGASPIFVTDKFGWRLTMAGRFGGVPISCENLEPVAAVLEATTGRGVDIAIEAAWADQSVQQAAAMARHGGRLVLVGISGDDCLTMKHSTCRRKGLTIRLARRMKHVYPRAIALLENRSVDLMGMVSHRFKLEETPRAFAMNAAYEDGVVKVVIDIG